MYSLCMIIMFVVVTREETHERDSDEKCRDRCVLVSCRRVDDWEEIRRRDVEERSSGECCRESDDHLRDIRQDDIWDEISERCCDGKKCNQEYLDISREFRLTHERCEWEGYGYLVYCYTEEDRISGSLG